MVHATYTVHASVYIRGAAIVVVPPEDDLVSKSPTAALAEAFSQGKYSYREHGYILSAVAVRHFVHAVRLGCKVVHDDVIGLDAGGRWVTFSAKHPRVGLRACARRE